ncbi:MAG: hypothetical protein Q8R47_06130 [Nanoarchaeota archaeon]|nr:hypothetical protein [Nanoarchaeota archaeon]
MSQEIDYLQLLNNASYQLARRELTLAQCCIMVYRIAEQEGAANTAETLKGLIQGVHRNLNKYRTVIPNTKELPLEIRTAMGELLDERIRSLELTLNK